MFFNLTSNQDLTSFLVSRKITPNQAYFCHLIYSQDMANFYRYVHEFKQFTKEEVEDLEDRGYIVNQDHHNKTKFSDMYVVTDLLLDGLNLLDESAGHEFWNLYPGFIIVNNLRVPAKSTDKDLLIRDYTRKAAGGVDQHKRILGLLEYAIRHNMITMGIRKWVDSQQWDVVEQEMHNHSNSPTYGEDEFEVPQN